VYTLADSGLNLTVSEDLSTSVLSKLKKLHPSGNLKFDNLGISQILKLRILAGKIPPISLKLNFTPNRLQAVLG